MTAPKKSYLLKALLQLRSNSNTETGDLPVEVDPNAFTGRQSLDGQGKYRWPTTRIRIAQKVGDDLQTALAELEVRHVEKKM